MDAQEIDKLAAANAKAPRVSLEYIESQIRQVWFTDAERTYRTSEAVPNPEGLTSDVVERLSLTTLCFILMKNGFLVMGHSTPAAEENFSRELGRQFAYDNAFKQLWPILGYELRTELARLEKEHGFA